MSDFQPLVIGNKVNFPELNRRIEIEFIGGKKAFSSLVIYQCAFGQELAMFVGNSIQQIPFYPNLKWRYADQDVE